MGRLTSLLAVLLSLLMVSTSVSASACDLSCWLHQAHFDCHTASSSTTLEETPMSMSPDMDMSSNHSESMIQPDAGMNAIPGHSMPMSPELRMATERFESATKPELRTSALHNHSKAVSSCTHETCSQISASVSPPQADRCQPNSLHWVAINVSSPVNLWIDLHWIRPGTSPPKLLATHRLVTTLRI